MRLPRLINYRPRRKSQGEYDSRVPVGLCRLFHGAGACRHFILGAQVDDGGLRTYLTRMLRAYQTGDMETFRRLANGPGQAITMGQQCERSFLSFRSGLERGFERAGKGATDFEVERRNGPPAGATASPSAPAPKSDVKMIIFRIVMTTHGIGRKLRYIGQGAFPFWAAPRLRVENGR